MSEQTPMMRQYRALKDQHPNAILLFRLGDFFEAFFEDAQVVARELQLTLTSRPVAKGRRIPMCGIPHHALHTYLRRLIDRGHRVAICDQVEDPRQARTLVHREVVRVVTPGTVVEDDLLSARENNFLGSVASHGEEWGAAFADLSTGEFFATQGAAPDDLHAALALWHPRELLAPDPPPAGGVMEDVPLTGYEAERFSPKSPPGRFGSTSGSPPWTRSACMRRPWRPRRPARSSSTSGRRRRAPCPTWGPSAWSRGRQGWSSMRPRSEPSGCGRRARPSSVCST